MSQNIFAGICVPMAGETAFAGAALEINDFGHIKKISRTGLDTLAERPIGNYLLLPGFINNHVHLAYDYSFLSVEYGEQLDWLKKIALDSRPMMGDYKYLLTKKNIEKALSSGTTFVVENAPFVENLKAIQDSRIKALVGLEVFCVDKDRSDEIFKTSVERIEKLEAENNNSQVELTLSPHAIYSVTGKLMSDLARWSRDENKILLTHLAEFGFETSLCESGIIPKKLLEFYSILKLNLNLDIQSGKSPVKYFDSLGLLSSRLLVAHLLEADSEDFELLAKQDVRIASCPRSNSILKNQTAKLSLMKKHGLSFSIATDSLYSNFDLDLLEEVRAAAILHKELSARELLECITSVPAAQLDKKDEIGSIKEGACADLLVFELTDEQRKRALDALPDGIYEFIIRELRTSQLKRVLINGKDK